MCSPIQLMMKAEAACLLRRISSCVVVICMYSCMYRIMRVYNRAPSVAFPWSVDQWTSGAGHWQRALRSCDVSRRVGEYTSVRTRTERRSHIPGVIAWGRCVCDGGFV